MNVRRLLQTSLIKYGLVGLLGTALHFGLLVALVELAGARPVLASAAGFVVVLLVSYELNRRWTFNRAAPGARLHTFAKYAATSLMGLGLNTAIMYAAVDVLALPYTVGQAGVTLVIPVFNYIMNRTWTFAERETRAIEGKES